MPKDEKGREIPSRFYIGEGDLRFSDAAPLTEEEKAEAAAIWEAMTGGNYSPAKKKIEQKGYRVKEEGNEDINDWHIANVDVAIFYDADPLTKEDLAELANIKNMLNIE